ncbi:hypothetical protein H9W91_05920 [Streptomyces alfalfae]|uniref:hypothetical protein n=1 Tax=Streptomyces alfalfae TaxID=1642299 RepID=UPI001BAAD0BE|nr:hypothetical protein [Streptomyces alfalfae]QUI30442.1 hypothetical protein H9W91_05920 [Streptomyces alfalfae]
MDEQRERGPGGPLPARGGPGRQGSPRWIHGPRDGVGRGLPWLTTLALTAFVQIGSGFAVHAQPDREPLTALARALLLLATAVLLFRHRHPAAVVSATAGLTLVYLGAGFPYGPVLLAAAVACFAAVVAGRRRAAWGAVGALWAGHLLLSHWLYERLPPGDDGERPWGGELVVAVWVVAIVAVSGLVRVRRERWAEERAERARAAERRADEERLRMAVKLGARDRAQLVVLAYESGLVRSGWLGRAEFSMRAHVLHVHLITMQ